MQRQVRWFAGSSNGPSRHSNLLYLALQRRRQSKSTQDEKLTRGFTTFTPLQFLETVPRLNLISQSNMAAKKQKIRNATKAVKPKNTTTPKTIKKKKSVVETPGTEEVVDISALRRSARVAQKSAVKSAAARLRKGLGGPYSKMYELARAIPWTEATATRRMRLYEYFLAEFADVEFFSGYTNEQVRTIFQKIQALPEDQRREPFEKAFKAAFDGIFAGTFGFHGPHTRNKSGDHVWFWDQALGCWRRWVIAGTGRVEETFHLTAPPEVTTIWQTELRRRGHPGLDLRAQPAFHLVDDSKSEKKVKVLEMPLIIVADSKHFTDLDPRDVEDETELDCLKTSVVDEAVAKHFRIPVDRIWDPCLTISFKRAMEKYRRGQVFWDPTDPLGFQKYESPKKAVGQPGEVYGPWGTTCWDWVFSDFILNGDDDEYFFQRDGDTYTLTLKKPEALKDKEAAAWHADVPYGPFMAFAKKVEATFWPPTPPPVLNSAGVPQASSSARQSSSTFAITSPKSPFALASVPITRYRSGQAFDANRLSRHAAHFAISSIRTKQNYRIEQAYSIGHEQPLVILDKRRR
ncbi:hypothetical protein KCU65_g387, partial [Aureobasidium melanogenum]